MNKIIIALLLFFSLPCCSASGNPGYGMISVVVAPENNGVLKIKMSNKSEDYYVFQTLRVLLPWSQSGLGMNLYVMTVKPPFSIFRHLPAMISNTQEVSIYPGESMSGNLNMLNAFIDPKGGFDKGLEPALKETPVYVFWFYQIFDLNSKEFDSRSGVVLLPRLVKQGPHEP